MTSSDNHEVPGVFRLEARPSIPTVYVGIRASFPLPYRLIHTMSVRLLFKFHNVAWPIQIYT